MEDSDGFLKNIQKIEKTKILPLRWIGNLCGEIASDHLVEAMYMDENGDYGYRFKFHGKVWKYLNKPYEWWGTYYMLEIDEK